VLKGLAKPIPFIIFKINGIFSETQKPRLSIQEAVLGQGMKICNTCSGQNLDTAVFCKICKGTSFYVKRPQEAQGTAAPPGARARAGLISRFTTSSVVILLCLAALGGELGWEQFRLSQQTARFAADQAKAQSDRDAAVAAKARDLQSQLDQEQAKHQLRMHDEARLSGALARSNHEHEWARRIAHDPQLVRTPLEQNMVTMEQLGKDPHLEADVALERVARLASPPGSRVEVTPGLDGYYIRVAFRMSSLRQKETGPVTQYHTVGELRSAIQELTAGVMQTLYDYCGTRGIKSISVTCDHTVRQAMVPADASEAERESLIEKGDIVNMALYRMSLDEAAARAIPNWRQASLSRVIKIISLDHDGLINLTIVPSSAGWSGAGEDPGPLQF
jgi:cell division protein FtsB